MIVKAKAPGELNDTIWGELEIKKNAIMVHQSGKLYIRYLYVDLIDNIVEDFRKNIASEYDNVVVVDGPEGSGKSNLGWELCKRYDPEIAADPVKKMRDCYVYSFDDLRYKVLELTKTNADVGRVFWLDETSNMANNRAWMKQDNQYLVQILEMMRSRGWTLIMCIPTKDRLDLYIREYRLRYWFHCEPAKFDQDDMMVDRGYFETHKYINSQEKGGGYGEYPPMPPEEEAEYKRLKAESQAKKFAEAFEEKGKGSKYKKMYEDERKKQRNIMLCLSRSGTMDTAGIMQLFGYTDPQQYYNAITKAKREAEGNGEI